MYTILKTRMTSGLVEVRTRGGGSGGRGVEGVEPLEFYSGTSTSPVVGNQTGV